MKSYKQLTQEQRNQIYVLMKADHTQTDISDLIGIHKYTVSHELRRNSGLKGYRPQKPHRFCMQRCRQKATPRIAPSIWALVKGLIREQRSPKQISEWLQSECQNTISIEWIYQYILSDKQARGTFYQYLRCQTQPEKRYSVYSYRGQRADQVSIEQRSVIVGTRSRYGDWELDAVIGNNHQQAFVTFVERKSCLTMIAKVIRKTTKNVFDAIVSLLFILKPWVHTLTEDNGREFAHHTDIVKQLKNRLYFAHSYASWERGPNENTNGPIRSYFQKKHDFRPSLRFKLNM